MHSQPPNPSTPQNRFDQVRQQLENYPQHAGNDAPPSDLADAIDAERQDAVRRGDQDWANQAWCLEQVHRVQQAYGRAFSELKHHEFYKAWCSLEEAEIALVQLAPHHPEQTEGGHDRDRRHREDPGRVGAFEPQTPEPGGGGGRSLGAGHRSLGSS